MRGNVCLWVAQDATDEQLVVWALCHNGGLGARDTPLAACAAPRAALAPQRQPCCVSATSPVPQSWPGVPPRRRRVQRLPQARPKVPARSPPPQWARPTYGWRCAGRTRPCAADAAQRDEIQAASWTHPIPATTATGASKRSAGQPRDVPLFPSCPRLPLHPAVPLSIPCCIPPPLLPPPPPLLLLPPRRMLACTMATPRLPSHSAMSSPALCSITSSSDAGSSSGPAGQQQRWQAGVVVRLKLSALWSATLAARFL